MTIIKDVKIIDTLQLGNILMATSDQGIIHLFLRKEHPDDSFLLLKSFLSNRFSSFNFSFFLIHKSIIRSLINFILTSEPTDPRYPRDICKL